MKCFTLIINLNLKNIIFVYPKDNAYFTVDGVGPLLASFLQVALLTSIQMAPH